MPLSPFSSNPSDLDSEHVRLDAEALLSDIIETQSDLAAVELDPQVIMRMVAERTQRLTCADGAAVQLIEGDFLVCQAGTGIMEAHNGRKLSLAASLASHAVRGGSVQYSEDVESDPKADPISFRELGLRSLVVVPLFNGTQAIGVMCVASRRPAAFSQRLISALRLMAGLVVVSLSNASEFGFKKKLLAERTEALSALRGSDNRFQSAFEHAAIGMALVGIDGRWLQVNGALCGIVGYTENELLVSDFQSITFPEDLNADLAFVRQLIAGDIPHYQMVKRYIHRQGHLVWVLLSVSLVRDETGKPLYFISQIQDITQRQHAEEKLRDQAALLDLSHDTIMVRGMDGTILFWNHGAEEMYGYTKDEAIGRTSHELLGTEFPRPLGEINERLLREGRWEGELKHTARGGKRIIAASRWVLQLDQSGRPWRTMEMNNDITKRKHAEEALRTSEEEYRATFELAGVGKVQMDLTNGRFIRVNEKFCQITGYSTDELRSRSFAQITHPDDLKTSRYLVERMLSGEISDHSTEKRYLRKDGEVIWVSMNATVLKEPNGRTARAVATILDITERKHTEWLEQDRRRVLEMVAKDMPLPEVLDQLAQAVERQIDGSVAAVMVLHEGSMLLHGPSLPQGWREQLDAQGLLLAAKLSEGVWNAEDACGVTCLRKDEVWERLRPMALKVGLTTCWTVIIQAVDGTTLGLLMVFCRQPRHPKQTDLQTLGMAGKLATICVERHHTTEQLSHLVRHDRLTGLPNRLMFEDRVQQALGVALRTRKNVGLMVLDIDKFKSINDTLGHHAGDHLLQQFAQRLRNCLREADTMARIGGDEFVVILPELETTEGASFVAQKLLNSLTAPFILAERSVQVTSSIGVAIFPQDGEDAVTLQKKADEALYRVKERGRNGFSF
jgi:diguanylate cyclase (GGDEF)-like protein/PAS domain S-box-containing protein